jgi:hypothetical protein
LVDVSAVSGSKLDEDVQGHFELFCVSSTHYVDIAVMDELELKCGIKAKGRLFEGVIK